METTRTSERISKAMQAFPTRRTADLDEPCEVQLQRADAYLQTGLVEDARVLYERLLERGAHIPDARLGLARCAYARRNFHEALGHLQDLSRREPDHPGVHNDLGVTYFELGLSEKAHEELRIAANQNPDDPTTWRNLVDVAFALGSREACLEYCNRLLALTPAEPELRELKRRLESGEI